MVSHLFLGCLLAVIGYAAATFSMSSYACNQPQIYNQCQCQTFCSPYQSGGNYAGSNGGGYSSSYPSQSGYGGSDQYDEYRSFIETHRPRHHKKKHHKHRHHKPKPVSVEENIDSLEDFDSKEFATTTRRPVVTTTASDWEDEDLWEKKFVGKKRPIATDDEEFPEIDSAEIERAKQRQRLQQQQSQLGSSRGGGGGGIGLGTGIGAGPIGVNTGLGIGAPGIGGLGGGGGLFGISSGVGVGIPGVGPIGVSSGLGIGK